MGLDGGGGGGGILGVGDSFTGPSESLEILGNHCFAYAGPLTVGSVGEVTALQFTTGNYYAVVNYSPQYNTNNSEDFIFNIKLNGSTIFSQIINDQDNQPFTSVELVLPSYTLVEITIEPSGHTTDRSLSVLVTGRIYR